MPLKIIQIDKDIGNELENVRIENRISYFCVGETVSKTKFHEVSRVNGPLFLKIVMIVKIIWVLLTAESYQNIYINSWKIQFPGISPKYIKN